MKYYIATRLERAADHNTIRDALSALGHGITYDWTTHGPVWRSGAAVIRDVARKEADGVSDADFVVVLLPGGRGTHAELGMAIALGKPIVLHSDDPDMFVASPQTCVFYHSPTVRHVGCDFGQLPKALPALIEQAMALAPTKPRKHTTDCSRFITSGRMACDCGA